MTPALRKSSASASGTAPGYSGTPLAKKLGIVEGRTVLQLAAPAQLGEWLAPLPARVSFAKRAGAQVDIAHVFATRRADLDKHLRTLRRSLRPDAAVWVSWPKKTSGVASDISEDVIRALALPLGFVDVKVCAVSEVWSGLKIVVRKQLRAPGRHAPNT
jgi:hypothetical protein